MYLDIEVNIEKGTLSIPTEKTVQISNITHMQRQEKLY